MGMSFLSDRCCIVREYWLWTMLDESMRRFYISNRVVLLETTIVSISNHNRYIILILEPRANKSVATDCWENHQPGPCIKSHIPGLINQWNRWKLVCINSTLNALFTLQLLLTPTVRIMSYVYIMCTFSASEWKGKVLTPTSKLHKQLLVLYNDRGMEV